MSAVSDRVPMHISSFPLESQNPLRIVASSIGERRMGCRLGNVPEAELAVAGGVGVPVGDRLEHVAQPGALHDKRRKTRVGGHDGRWGVA